MSFVSKIIKPAFYLTDTRIGSRFTNCIYRMIVWNIQRPLETDDTGLTTVGEISPVYKVYFITRFICTDIAIIIDKISFHLTIVGGRVNHGLLYVFLCLL